MIEPLLTPTHPYPFETLLNEPCACTLEFVQDRVHKAPAEQAAMAITQRCLDNGLVVQVASHKGVQTVWRIAPPLTITYDELNRGIAIIDEAIAEITGQ